MADLPPNWSHLQPFWARRQRVLLANAAPPAGAQKHFTPWFLGGAAGSSMCDILSSPTWRWNKLKSFRAVMISGTRQRRASASHADWY